MPQDLLAQLLRTLATYQPLHVVPFMCQLRGVIPPPPPLEGMRPALRCLKLGPPLPFGALAHTDGEWVGHWLGRKSLPN